MPRFTPNEDEGPRGPLEPGEYPFVVLARARVGRDEYSTRESTSKSGNDMIELILEVNSQIVFERLVFSENTAWRIQGFMRAAGLPYAAGYPVDLSARDCVGARGICRIDIDSYENRSGKTVRRNVVSEWIPSPDWKPLDATRLRAATPPPADTIPDDIPF